MNLFGVDVAGLDVPAFLAAGRLWFVAASFALLILVAWRRQAGWLLAGVVAANAYVWLVTNYPLQRVYALGPSQDRIGNLGLCQVVAAGNSPLHTAQVGHIHFEPLWGLLVAVLSGWNPDRVLALYPFLPLAVLVAFTLALYWGLGGGVAASEDSAWSPWERAVIAGAATLLACAPLDFTGTYRVPWAMTFLLKPNHALALVLFPVFLKVFWGEGWGRRLAAGLVLHLIGWAFVLHMAYVSFGLLVFAALSVLTREVDARRDVFDVFAVLGVNLLVVSPYLVMLVMGYPFLQPSPLATIFVASPHLLETTVRLGPVLVLGIWGAVVAYRRRDRLGRAWASQVLGAHLLWVGYLILDRLQMARERDEIFYWVRFLTAASAGIGAWDLARRATVWLGRPLAAPARAAALALIALPWSLPAWWEPARMDSYFTGSLVPLPEPLREATDFLRSRTDPKGVVAGDRDLAKWVAALGARRVLMSNNLHYPKDYLERGRVEEALVRGTDGEAARTAAARFGVRYLTVTPALLERFPGLTLEELEGRSYLSLLRRFGSPQDYVALFELR